jgi:small subunit ribosomal protein S16
MSVKIRLARFGAKKAPHFRLVVADARSPRDGKFVDTIGHYNPKSDPPQYTLDQERAKLWLGRGAEPTMAAARVLFKFGLIEQPWKDLPAQPDKATSGKGAATAVAAPAAAAPVAVAEAPAPAVEAPADETAPDEAAPAAPADATETAETQ